MRLYYKFDEAPVYFDSTHGLTDTVRLSCRGENMSAITCDFPKGFTWVPHSHVHEQLTVVLSGRIDYTVDGETFRMGPGDTLYVPSNAMHHAVALTECRCMDVFTPVRADQMAWFDDPTE